ncbi:MAG: mechanosensitive ion channel family protein [Leeuwenhoekiella sp.]
MIEKFSGEFRTLSMVAIIIVATFIFSFIFNWFLKRYIRKSLIKHERDLTSFQFFRHILTAIIYMVGFAAALVQIPEFKIVGHSLLAGAGVLSLVAGLASQQALSNIMSGILIVVFKPFRLNDRITVQNNYTGTVEDINLRQVVIRDFENNRIIIPNSVISTDIIVNAHMNDTKCCKMIDVGVGYSSNLERALEIMVDEIAKHPFYVDNRSQKDIENKVPPVIARVTALGESSINLRVWAWAANPSDAFILNCDFLQSIKRRFDAEGIEIPFPQRVVTMINDLKEAATS